MIAIDNIKAEQHFVFGDFTVYKSGVLLHKKNRINIPPKEFKVLNVLLSLAGQLVTKDALLDQVWSGEDASEESLTRCIYALRKILLETKEKRYIETFYGKGYRFNCKVSTVFTNIDSVVNTSNINTSNSPCKLAILPFQTGNLEQTQNIHDALIYSISNYEAFDLIVLPAILTKNCVNGSDVLELVKNFSPDYYLAGQSILTRGQYILRTELVRAKDHALIYRENIKIIDESDIDELNKSILSILQKHIPRLQLEPIVKKLPAINGVSTTDSIIYSDSVIAYINAKYKLSLYTPTSLKQALSYFQIFIERNPNHIQALCGLIETYFALSVFGILPQKIALREVLCILNKILEISPNYPLALTLLAFIDFRHKPLTAEVIFNQVELLSLEFSQIHYYYAWHLFGAGELDLAINQLDIYLKKNPENISGFLLKVWLMFCSVNTNKNSKYDLNKSIKENKYKQILIYIAKIENDLPKIKNQLQSHPIWQSMVAVILMLDGQSQLAKNISKLSMHNSENANFIIGNYGYVLNSTDAHKACLFLENLSKQSLDKQELICPTLLPLILKIEGEQVAMKLYEKYITKEYFGLTALMYDPRLYDLRLAINIKKQQHLLAANSSSEYGCEFCEYSHN